jgi:hypothetical protein
MHPYKWWCFVGGFDQGRSKPSTRSRPRVAFLRIPARTEYLPHADAPNRSVATCLVRQDQHGWRTSAAQLLSVSSSTRRAALENQEPAMVPAHSTRIWSRPCATSRRWSINGWSSCRLAVKRASPWSSEERIWSSVDMPQCCRRPASQSQAARRASRFEPAEPVAWLGVPPRHAMTAVYPGLVGCTHVSVSGPVCSGGACGPFDGYVLGSNGAGRPEGGGSKSWIALTARAASAR